MLKRMRTYLGVIFAIFARDVKRVLRNPVALVIALGMIVMPSAYAWYVVAANWDPYSNTADMLVAVANEDAGADSPETGHLDVGAQVVAQLHDNHEMGWEFTDAEAAINGVYEGRYWAALVIPKDFSADFASVFTGDFTQPTIDYYVNEKPSSIAPKVTAAPKKLSAKPAQPWKGSSAPWAIRGRPSLAPTTRWRGFKTTCRICWRPSGSRRSCWRRRGAP